MRWLHMALKLPDASSFPAGSTPFKLSPKSSRVAVEEEIKAYIAAA